MTTWWRTAAAWLGGREPLVLISVLVVVAAAWGFISTAAEVVEGDTKAFDRWVVRAMRQAEDPSAPVGPAWLQEFGRDVTALGSHGALALVTVVVAGFLLLDRRYRMTFLLLAATSGGMLMSTTLKSVISRPRPDVVPHLTHVSTSSFPSAHSMVSAVVYLTLGALVATVTRRRRQRIYVLCMAIMLPMLIGVSRVYLGVHYPTDVLAGWMAGLVWAVLCWLSARWLQRRRHIERSRRAQGGATLA